MLDKLKGRKTYLIVALAVIIWGAEQAGLISAGTSNKVDGLLALLGLGTLRAAVADTLK